MQSLDTQADTESSRVKVQIKCIQQKQESNSNKVTKHHDLIWLWWLNSPVPEGLEYQTDD